ncbi:MAG: outer membrane protein assembly factor BamA [Methylococcaceae bacterium]|nr:outer membrane protein assembly factor BamA [Methylococcaceae bacterium]MDD1607193.1 outer membrane protein assembly factor BamA [Methylococcaceae bacterium]MDD1609961.1 outer membrane protein assembly factor BamA [Methylococcaceae bacterium]MDD1616238.1 outer membrane protein assembly factor BamA [Methylococcaceae bacterium]OYV18183.1 MAG: outer membrane protein [Methylococcaceae bacterium NSP1-2]
MKSNTFSRLLLLCLFASQAVEADEEFIVRDIQVKGLQRISVGTVYNDFPVNVGEKFSLDHSAAAIRALFKTGFFKDVSLSKEGSTLVINVVERPTIAKIAFEGNKDLSKDDLTKALDKIGLSEGKVFDRQVLDKVEQELSRQYLSHGKYGLKIKTDVTTLTRNRVGINITISEGRVTKIKQINIIGNNAFDDKTLLSKFELSPSDLLSFYTKNDQYSKQKLSADLESLLSYYLDRGYINFAIESTQVAITPDKKDIYVTINVKEGDVYTLNKVKLAGNLVVPPDQLTKLVSVGPGEVFSRKNATETSKAIQDRLGDEGYAFANVNMVPEIIEATKTVDMTFAVDPGKRVYVNRINVRGNTTTRDEVLRREMRQMESSWASSSKIERSKVRLERLGYFESVNVETPPVAGTADQIDANYTVVEKPSGNLSAGIGYSQVQGIILNANVSQDNVFGSGKRVNLAFNNSTYTTNYQFGFFNPYFTVDGVSQGYNLGYAKRNAGAVNLSNYTTDVGNIGTNFGIPLNEFDMLRFDTDLRHTNLKINDYTDSFGNTSNAYVSKQIRDFVREEGNKYWTLGETISWTHDTLNRALFPNQGGQQRASAQIIVPGSDLQYYKVGYRHQHYFPIAKDFTFKLNGEIAYGDGYGSTASLPFFENYFAGGTGSVRGFKNNTLGPRDTQENLLNGTFIQGNPIGGSSKIIGNAELFFPVPFMTETKSVRLGTFFDAGTVSKGFSVNEMRYSAGLSGEWLSPFGALSVSAAYPINAAPTDQKQAFQFNFGQSF